MMRIVTLILCLAWLTPAWLSAQEIKVTPLLSRELTEFPGKEGTMIAVVYPPGGSETIHRHNAHVFVYVLQGSVVMQVRGGKEMILTAGQTFYESLTDIHVIGRNASKTEPAKFIAFFVKDKGAPTHIPAN
jgi:quercetin dioxygenase-like cupin family protein